MCASYRGELSIRGTLNKEKKRWTRRGRPAAGDMESESCHAQGLIGLLADRYWKIHPTDRLDQERPSDVALHAALCVYLPTYICHCRKRIVLTAPVLFASEFRTALVVFLLTLTLLVHPPCCTLTTCLQLCVVCKFIAAVLWVGVCWWMSDLCSDDFYSISSLVGNTICRKLWKKYQLSLHSRYIKCYLRRKIKLCFLLKITKRSISTLNNCIEVVITNQN